MYHWFNFSRVLHFILFLFTLEFYKETFRWTTKKLNKRLHNEIARFVQLFIFFFKAQIIVYRSIAIGQPNLFFELGITKWKIENGKSVVRLNQRMKSVIIHGNLLFMIDRFFRFRFEILYYFVTISETFDRAIYRFLLEWEIIDEYAGTLFFWDNIWFFKLYKIYLFYIIEDCKLFDLLNYSIFQLWDIYAEYAYHWNLNQFFQWFIFYIFQFVIRNRSSSICKDKIMFRG